MTFAQVNLVEDAYPSLATDTNSMDVIFCRNVLMYFTPSQAAKAVHQLRCALIEGGWLAVSPCETSQALFFRFAPASFAGAILYQKRDGQVQSAPSWEPPLRNEPSLSVAPELQVPGLEMPPTEEPHQPTAPSAPLAVATSLYQQGRYADAAETLVNSMAAHDAPTPQAFCLLVRALANQGELAGALNWCDRWVATDKLDASGHYLLRAVVLQGHSATASARAIHCNGRPFLRTGLRAGPFRFGESRARRRQERRG